MEPIIEKQLEYKYLTENEIQNIFKNNKQSCLKVSYILSQLNFLEISNFKFTLSSLKRLYLFRLIKGFNNYEKLKDYLNEHQEEAFQLGIYKDENNKPNLPPKRTYNHILQSKISSEEKHQLDLLAERILFLATENNVIIDLEIVKKSIREKKKNHDKEIKEAIKLIKKLVYPQIDLKIKSNGKFTTKDLLDVLVHTALTHDFTNNVSFTFN